MANRYDILLKKPKARPTTSSHSNPYQRVVGSVIYDGDLITQQGNTTENFAIKGPTGHTITIPKRKFADMLRVMPDINGLFIHVSEKHLNSLFGSEDLKKISSDG